MSEIFPQDTFQGPSGGKFRIVDPTTGEEVHAPVDSKKFRIINPGTGQEVLPDADAAQDQENAHPGVWTEWNQSSSFSPAW